MTGALTGRYPNRTTINTLINGGMKRFHAAVQARSSIAERHNAFTDHCLALLFSCTGCRPVKDPFQSLAHFDLDRGLLLVSDKVVDEDRAWRLVALPEIAVSQVRAYLDYLPRLASHIIVESSTKKLAEEIINIVQGFAELPLFFYIDELAKDSWRHVSPVLMSKRWEERWALPINFLRHVTATELARKSVRADWVQIQLGHIEGIDHPFGQTSTLNPLSELGQIGICINACMEGLGWKHLSFPIRKTDSCPAPTRKEPLGAQKYLLGNERRALERNRRNQKVKDLVQVTIGDALGKTNLRTVSSDEFNSLVRTILSEAISKKLPPNKCLTRAYQLIKNHKGGNDLLRRISHIRLIETEASPFTEISLDAYRQLEHTRVKFLEYLEQRGRVESIPNAEERIAEIIISAAIFGGLANKHRLISLEVVLRSHVFRIGEQLFVDILLTKNEREPIFRWFPDPISSALIKGFYRQNLGSASPLSRSVKAQLRTFAGEIGLDAVQPLLELVRLSSAGLTLEMPGYVAAALRGDIPAVSLPLAQFVRVVFERALQIPAEVHVESIQQDKFSSWLRETRRDENRKLDATESARFRAKMRKIILECLDVPARGNKNVYTKCKRELIFALKQAFRNPMEWSSWSVSVVAWVVHLCEFGTRSKVNIAYTTISRYTRQVMNSLLRLQDGQDFLTLSDIAYEEIYLRALESEPEHRRLDLAGRLKEFHEYLILRYQVEEPDWSGVYAAAGVVTVKLYADANVVTLQEYALAMSCIRVDENLSARTRAQYASLLFFGFRLGLRFGEAWRLQYKDVQYEEDVGELYLHVHNNMFGQVKTLSGVRTVSLLEKMLPDEAITIKEILNLAGDRFEEDVQIPLMAESDDSRKLINRYAAAAYLGNLLRELTGDTSLRFHHLRHSWVTRMVGEQHFSNTENLNQTPSVFKADELVPKYWKCFIGAGPVTYPIRSVMTAIGHANEATTLAGYAHCLDHIAGSLMCSRNSNLSDEGFSYCESVKPAAIRKRRSRGSTAVQGKEIPQPPILLKDRVAVLPIKTVDNKSNARLSLVQIDTLLRRYKETRCEIGLLAHRLLVNADSANAMLDSAARIERASGYTRYQLEEKNFDPIVVSGGKSTNRNKLFNSETKRITQLLAKLDGRFDYFSQKQMHALKLGISVWCKTFEHTTYTNIATDLGEVKALLDLFVLLEFEINKTLIVASSSDEGELQKLLLMFGLPVKSGSIPYANEKTSVRRRGRISVSLEKNTMGGTIREIHRVLFILATATL